VGVGDENKEQLKSIDSRFDSVNSVINVILLRDEALIDTGVGNPPLRSNNATASEISYASTDLDRAQRGRFVRD